MGAGIPDPRSLPAWARLGEFEVTPTSDLFVAGWCLAAVRGPSSDPRVEAWSSIDLTEAGRAGFLGYADSPLGLLADGDLIELTYPEEGMPGGAGRRYYRAQPGMARADLEAYWSGSPNPPGAGEGAVATGVLREGPEGLVRLASRAWGPEGVGEWRRG